MKPASDANVLPDYHAASLAEPLSWLIIRIVDGDIKKMNMVVKENGRNIVKILK